MTTTEQTILLLLRRLVASALASGSFYTREQWPAQRVTQGSDVVFEEHGFIVHRMRLTELDGYFGPPAVITFLLNGERVDVTTAEQSTKVAAYDEQMKFGWGHAQGSGT